MEKEARQYTVRIGNQTVTIETGKLAGQAGGAVTLQIGDSLILGTSTMSKEPRAGLNFLPLSVDFEERMYAGGKIPGSFFRREGRPTEEAVLTSRLTDRPLRPLFPKGMRNDIQVIIYALSSDGINPLDVMAVNAASAALMISDIPWAGPIGAVRVGRMDGEFVINPTYEQLKDSDLDLRLAGSKDAILMVESASNEVSEMSIINAMQFGHDAIQPFLDIQLRMASEIGKPKREIILPEGESEIEDVVYNRATERLSELFREPYDKKVFYSTLDTIKDEIVSEFAEDEDNVRSIKNSFDKAFKFSVRHRILTEGIRPDGRGVNDVRPIWADIDISPRTHGSGLFTRGETQVLTMATLGTPREAQALDNLTPFDEKRYMHHYNFPPFSTGETRFLRGTSRRETGHGVLAERALIPVIPSEKDFPYTIRLVSEVLSSNGSSSMASVCGSTLALMDTGVPIKAPVSGVAMGLIIESDSYAILTDILGMEDHLGDMDFKVAGTREGITALQMDIKVKGLSFEILTDALNKAQVARLSILDKMLEVIDTPRQEFKPHVPRIVTIQIPVSKIGAVIGQSGKTIRALQEETNTSIDIAEDGTIYISTENADNANAALAAIQKITEEAELGRIYTGKVVRVADFGAFVEILPSTDGMVHISQLDSQRINKVEDVAKLGDEITVMVTAIAPDGKIRLSRKAVLEGWTVEEAIEQENAGKRRKSSRPPGGKRPYDKRQGNKYNKR